MKPPRLRGSALRLARVAAESGASIVANALKTSLGIDRLRALPHDARAELPQSLRPVAARGESLPGDASLPATVPRQWPREVRSFGKAYTEGTTTPVAVAERAIAELEKLRQGRELNVLVAALPALARKDAAASLERYKAGNPKSPVDGVPFLVKDEFDVAGTPTTLGSQCESTDAKLADSTPVARLRAAGAIFIGKTVLTEWGMSPLGQNIHQTMPHNAHHRNRVPGGSSTGSAVGVALGLAPIALGGDGGGSIRIPSCLNGVFGIKPTFGRVSRAGDGFAGSVAHAGPIGASAFDLALALDIIASEQDPLDELTAWAPPPPSGGFGSRLRASVKGMRIGVPDDEWADASEPVARAGRAALAALEKEGATLVPLKLPLARDAAPIGYITIGCESFAVAREAWETKRNKIGDDVRVSYGVVATLSAMDYLDAQRLRRALRLEAARALAGVDVIAMPTTATTAPALPDVDRFGAFSDPAAIDAMCRFAFLGNLTGLPAGTAPVGEDVDGLPIGVQIVGDAWQEATVLGVLSHLERIGIAAPKRSPWAIDLIA